jgi:hypothetical protein
MTSPLSIRALAAGFALCAALPAVHAQPAAKTFSGEAVTGTMQIDFQTRQRGNADSDGQPNKGVKDTYAVDLKVGAVTLKGKVERSPRITSKMLGREVQRGQIFYGLALAVQGTYLGDWLGTAVTDERGYYLFDGSGDPNSKPRIQIQAVGNQVAFTDTFGGVMLGKGTGASGAVKFARQVTNSKKVFYTAKNTDPMDFRNLVLAKGPLGSHARATVAGKLIYDRESGSWLTDGITILTEGQKEADTITGSIRWIEDPQRSANGKGSYVFNLRWNEDKQAPTESTFTASDVDEESFFAVDNSKPGLTGSIDYVDRMDGEKVIGSTVTYKLVSNNLTRNQVLQFVKLWLCGIGPINDE